MFIRAKNQQRQRGVSLLEVLISIVVIAIGVLGLAKMQALSISNTTISGSRSLVAMQASDLAAMMHANNAFWQVKSTATPPCGSATACTISGTAIPTSFGTAPAVSGCTYASPCTAQQIAALDLTTWTKVMNSQVPTYSLNITCNNTTPTALPVTTCVIKITWLEKAQGMNQTTASMAAATTSTSQSYYLYVQP
jgi:type IV pilus assembly protein PilV